jgi:hypothetical protein
METKDLILAEQILINSLSNYGDFNIMQDVEQALTGNGTQAVLKAMETYAQQQTPKLQADNTLLKEVNEAQAFTIDKYKADKDKLSELLEEIKNDGSVMGDISEEKAEYYKEQIEQTLSECGY